MAFAPPGPAAIVATAERFRAERATRRISLVDRLQESYRAEPDRSYAEAFYGGLLRDLGVAPRG